MSTFTANPAYDALLLFLFLFGTASQLTAQDGKLLERTPYTVADSSIAQWRSRMPDIDGIMAGVRLSRITYLSDGLKVKALVRSGAPVERRYRVVVK